MIFIDLPQTCLSHEHTAVGILEHRVGGNASHEASPFEAYICLVAVLQLVPPFCERDLVQGFMKFARTKNGWIRWMFEERFRWIRNPNRTSSWLVFLCQGSVNIICSKTLRVKIRSKCVTAYRITRLTITRSSSIWSLR